MTEGSAQTEKRASKKNDLILVSVLLILAACFFFFFSAGNSKESGESKQAVISRDGNDIISVPLSKSYSEKKSAQYLNYLSEGSDFTVKGISCEKGSLSFELETPYGSNLFLLTEGGISCTEANCPDLVCVSEGVASLYTDTIVCLPHRLIVRIEPL